MRKCGKTLKVVKKMCKNYFPPDKLDGAQAEKESTISATGTGPIDAAFKALRIQMEGSGDVKLLEYTVTSVTAGIDALGEVTVRSAAVGVL